MKATVTSSVNGSVRAIVSRGYRDEPVMGTHAELKVGEKILVKRQVNNPYLVRIQIIPAR